MKCDNGVTPQVGGDVPFSSTSRKFTTPRKDTSPIVQITNITRGRPKRQVKEVCAGSLLYPLLYVDDMLVIAKDIVEVK